MGMALTEVSNLTRPLPSAMHQPPAIWLRWKLEQLWGKKTGQPEAFCRNSAPLRLGGKYS